MRKSKWMHVESQAESINYQMNYVGIAESHPELKEEMNKLVEMIKEERRNADILTNALHDLVNKL